MIFIMMLVTGVLIGWRARAKIRTAARLGVNVIFGVRQ